MGTVIDSSVLVAAERGHLDLTAALSENREESYAISAIAVAEILHGTHRVPASRRGKAEAFVEGLMQRFPVLPFDLKSARIHARLWSESASIGVNLGERDLMIAAIALANECAVATRDRRSFPKIPGLRVVHW